jgi:hypothetical protein
MNDKKQQRENFRSKVFERDKFTCAMCGFKPEDVSELDAHHITSRHVMPFGGYCAANGITLCTDRCKKAPWIGASLDCHQKAEHLHATGIDYPGYTPQDLYDRIGYTYRWAYRESLKLGMDESEAEKLMWIIDNIVRKELDVCLELSEFLSQETWELACDNITSEPFVRAYGKGRYICR